MEYLSFGFYTPIHNETKKQCKSTQHNNFKYSLKCGKKFY